jgi:prepilin signal peptidase PulO-like enzyme (type II secretory pathway)
MLDLTPPLAGLAGLIAGTVIVNSMPRLVAYRLEEPPDPPPQAVRIPLAGGFISGWRPWWTLCIEVGMAALFVLLGLYLGLQRALPVMCLYAALLVAIATVDIQHRLVLNRLTYSGIVLALAASFLLPGVGFGSALLGFVTAFVLFWVIERLGRGAMGPGDTKLAALIGAMNGFPNLFNALVIGIVLGGLAAIFYLVVLRRGRKEKFAYGPYLVAGALAAMFMPHSSM